MLKLNIHSFIHSFIHSIMLLSHTYLFAYFEIDKKYFGFSFVIITLVWWCNSVTSCVLGFSEEDAICSGDAQESNVVGDSRTAQLMRTAFADLT